MRRRQNNLEGRSFVQSPCLPSWLWAGWAGAIDPWSWQSRCDFVKRGTAGAITTRETHLITTWQIIEPTSSMHLPVNQREISRTWYGFKERYRNLNNPLLEGWTRHTSPRIPPGNTSWAYPDFPTSERFRSHFYTHVSCPSQQFWFPILLR